MNIAWQEIFYVVATLSLIVVMIVFIWILRLLLTLSRLVSKLEYIARFMGNGIETVKTIRKIVALGILRKIRGLFEKGGE